MKKIKMKNAQQIWEAIDQGKTVYWSNEGYQLEVVDAKEDNEYAKPTYRNGKALRAYFTSNYFGSLVSKSCIRKCFILEPETTYIVAFEAVDGSDLVGFSDPADAMNFIMDIEDHVYNLALSYIEE